MGFCLHTIRRLSTDCLRTYWGVSSYTVRKGTECSSVKADSRHICIKREMIIITRFYACRVWVVMPFLCQRRLTGDQFTSHDYSTLGSWQWCQYNQYISSTFFCKFLSTFPLTSVEGDKWPSDIFVGPSSWIAVPARVRIDYSTPDFSASRHRPLSHM